MPAYYNPLSLKRVWSKILGSYFYIALNKPELPKQRCMSMKVGISMGKILNKIPKKKSIHWWKCLGPMWSKEKNYTARKKRLKRKEQIIKLTPKLIYWFKKKLQLKSQGNFFQTKNLILKWNYKKAVRKQYHKIERDWHYQILKHILNVNH